MRGEELAVVQLPEQILQSLEQLDRLAGGVDPGGDRLGEIAQALGGDACRVAGGLVGHGLDLRQLVEELPGAQGQGFARRGGEARRS